MKVSVKQFVHEVTGGRDMANFETGLKLLKKLNVPIDADAGPRKDCIDFAHYPAARLRYIEMQEAEEKEHKKDNFEGRRGVGGNNITGLSTRLREIQGQLDRMEETLQLLANVWGPSDASATPRKDG